MDNIERFKKTIKKEIDFLEKRLSAKGVYEQAIYMGYLDADRTFENQSKIKKDDSEVEKIAVKMKSYIDSDRDDFDTMFYEVCEDLCNNYDGMKFGQAQKIINMAFKYLYCIADNNVRPRFNKCHMPLDGIMLEWIHRNLKDKDGKVIKKVDSWSKIDKGTEDKDEADTYLYYKKCIDKYCKENNKTPLQLDFEHWVEMSQVIAAENYVKNFVKEELNENKHIKLLEKPVREKMEA